MFESKKMNITNIIIVIVQYHKYYIKIIYFFHDKHLSEQST